MGSFNKKGFASGIPIVYYDKAVLIFYKNDYKREKNRDYNLSELGNFDNIYEFLDCPNCFINLYLDYDEIYNEDDNFLWKIFTWIIVEKE